MEAYVNITLLPNPEIARSALMNNLFRQVHYAFVAIHNRRIGLSFPQHGKTLGAVLRLHGPGEALQQLLAQPQLSRFADYCQISDICPTPAEVAHRQVKRVQRKSAANKRKRSIAKGWLGPDEAQRTIPQQAKDTLEHPYLQISSGSTGQVMRIFIHHLPLQKEAIAGEFNSYGLSRSATVPWF